MTPQELKNNILQLAIQGKLVEQRPEEGTAEELYQQIQKEKQALIKTGKIKKEKPLPEIADDEKPFDIPESWMWARLGECTSYAESKLKVSPNEMTPDMWSLDLEDIEKGTGRIHTFCNATKRKITGEKVRFFKGQILYSKLRPYLKKILVAPEDGICTPELVPFSVYGGMNAEYLVNVLRAPHVDYVINSVTYGVKMPRVGTETMVNLLVPLPPVAEQKRIVAKIEELLPLIDRYEEAWTKLEEFNKHFPGDMQKSLLQMAIQGKLVEQRPEEGTGEELYAQIQAQKKELIKSGRIKKDKPLPEIADDEKPFSIPESWEWVYIGDLFQHNTGKALNSSDKSGNPYEYITTSNVYWNRFELDKLKTMLFTDAEIEKCTVQKGDLLVLEGGDCGRAAIWNYDFPMRIQNHIHRLRPYAEVCIKYFYHIFYLYKNAGMINGKGIAIQGLSANALHSLIVPLPPLAEQKRIVAKLEKLLPLCERLK